jgi:hypothetical protein
MFACPALSFFAGTPLGEVKNQPAAAVIPASRQARKSSGVSTLNAMPMPIERVRAASSLSWASVKRCASKPIKRNGTPIVRAGAACGSKCRQTVGCQVCSAAIRSGPCGLSSVAAGNSMVAFSGVDQSSRRASQLLPQLMNTGLPPGGQTPASALRVLTTSSMLPPLPRMQRQAGGDDPALAIDQRLAGHEDFIHALGKNHSYCG